MPEPHFRLVLVAAAVWVAVGAVVDTAWADDVQVNTYTTGAQLERALELEPDNALFRGNLDKLRAEGVR